jgi:hypothetical protein
VARIDGKTRIFSGVTAEPWREGQKSPGGAPAESAPPPEQRNKSGEPNRGEGQPPNQSKQTALQGGKATQEQADVQAEQFVALRARQAGAFSRNQAIAHGISDKELVSRRRSRQIQRIHRAVYADFTGPLPWRTRLWAVWLACGPAAAVSDETALRAYKISGDWPDDRVHLDIPHSQRVRGLARVVLHRRRDFASRLHRSREPPTVRLEVALLTVASRQTRTDRAVSIILDACRQRRTTPERLLEELAQLDRLPQRKVLLRVLSDAAQGVHSFLDACLSASGRACPWVAARTPPGPSRCRRSNYLPRCSLHAVRARGRT